MAKKQGHEKGAGHYSQNNVTFRRPNNIDESGTSIARKRDLSKIVGQISGDGASRAIHKPAVKRYES